MPSAHDYRKELVDRMVLTADDIFTHHVHTGQPGRYLVKRPRAGEYAFEAIELVNGSVLVGGDIDYAIFGYQPDRTPNVSIHWIGGSNDIQYVMQKANIGLGSRALTYDTDLDLAALELKEVTDEAKMPQLYDDLVTLLRSNGVEAAAEALIDELPDASDCLPLGLVPSVRVLYAWRGLKRLDQLLQTKVA